MRSFNLVHSYPFPPAAVLQAMLNPALDPYLVAHVPDLKVRQELDRREERGLIIRRSRCVPGHQIPDAAKHLVKQEMVEWVEEAKFDLAKGTITVGITPAGFKSIFSFKGGMRVEATPTGCVRHSTGEVSISMPIVGRLVEDYLVEEIRRNTDAEGNALRTFMQEQRPPASS